MWSRARLRRPGRAGEGVYGRAGGGVEGAGAAAGLGAAGLGGAPRPHRALAKGAAGGSVYLG